MSTTAQEVRLSSLPEIAGRGCIRQFSLLMTETPHVLVRVLVLLLRRGCTIVSVSFHRGDRNRRGRLDVAVRTDSPLAHRLSAWLLQLVDVVAVEEG